MAQKKVSKTFKAGCFTYTVHFQRDNDENHGSTDTSTKEIWINTRYDLQIQKETLFHELLHIAFEDCPILDKPYEKSFDEEEDIIRYISPKMVQILQDNPWLKEFIFE